MTCCVQFEFLASRHVNGSVNCFRNMNGTVCDVLNMQRFVISVSITKVYSNKMRRDISSHSSYKTIVQTRHTLSLDSDASFEGATMTIAVPILVICNLLHHFSS